VAAGQVIGASGRTSGTIGPRLHFGLLRGLAFDLNVVPLERP
jgi:murein DD-endopeptidase MepM/ murein hydrolase activator NlpD